MNRFISQKFRFYSFVCIALLLFVHGYNLRVTCLEPFSIVRERLTFTTFFEYLVANGLLRFRLPMLFAISGYIYAIQDYKIYPDRISKRFKTLMIPYFIWSAVGLLSRRRCISPALASRLQGKYRRKRILNQGCERGCCLSMPE